MKLKKFINIGSLLGVDDNKLSGGVVIDDFNGDGYYDIICSSWNLKDQMLYYVAQGDGSYKESHLQAGLKGITGGLNLLHADYNNDGHLDIFVLRGAWLADSDKHPNSLLRNNGNNTFTDVTKSSGLYSKHPTQTGAWADFNNDGWLDLFIGNETSSNSGEHPSELFLSQKDGTFKEIAQLVNANKTTFIKGVATADVDNDGDQDLYISSMNRPNIFLRNDTDDSAIGFHFTDISELSGTEEPLQSFPCWFFDYNNDGFEDLFVASYSPRFFNNVPSQYLKELTNVSFEAETPRLYRNDGDLKFTDITKEVGLDKVIFAMGSSFGDLNNDGFLDMYIGTGEPDLKAVIPNRAFINIAGKRFEEATSTLGLGHVQKGHAISIADLDHDGDQDIYAVMGGAYEGDIFFNALFENPGQGNDWLRVKLIGEQSNKAAYSARVKLTLSYNGAQETFYRTISSGSSFGENPTSIHFGIPDGRELVSLEVEWPTTSKNSYQGIDKNNTYTITEGDKEAKKTTIKPLKFILNTSHKHHD